ncbi:hypothetical protein VNO77_29398 [Canavalia gladiata]|uniref:Coatomer subunit zeta n=1 Tax=Canavalia gladiata TaxID=3824 RepID=A0AAN9L092_CANGL
MILAVLFANAEGNILIERFHGVPAEERLHWRSFLVKLGADNLRGVKNEELLVACHKSVYIVYTVLGDVSIYVVGKEEYDELALSEVIFGITSAVKDVCGKPPSERLFLDKYGRICLCLDEIVWKGYLENTEKERIKRLIRLKPPTETQSMVVATMKPLTIILTVCITASLSQARPIITQPQPNLSFNLNQTQPQNEGSSCTYTVTIKTSCKSPSYTRDQISLSFGDAYGYQVYVPRLDNPRSRTFERCSTDTFQIYGPCTYQVCYLYLYRTGYDGWIPEQVTVYGYNASPVTFYYNTYIPTGVWYGFDYCRRYSSASM